MKKKKVQTEENRDKMRRLQRRYTKWKEKQRLEELLEIDEYFMDEPADLDLERHW